MDFQVRRDDLHSTRFADAEEPELAEGEVLLGVDSFGLTTNNITYAVMGEAMSYWEFFPVAGGDGWVRMPVWGFVDASPHRAKLPAAYNRYIRVASLPFYDERYEDQQMLLWPLYFTSFLIDDFLDDEGFFGAKAVAVSSASSRTSSALAWLIKRREGVEVIGLTSPRNVEFTESLGVYDRVVPYEELDSLEREPVVYVDLSGDAKIRSAVHGHWGDELKHSAAVGITHREDLGGAEDLAGPRPTFFFAPDRLRKRTEDWGAEGVNTRLAETWSDYVQWTLGWLRVERGSGAEDVERIYRELLDGKSDPAVGHVLSPE